MQVFEAYILTMAYHIDQSFVRAEADCDSALTFR